MIREYSLSSKLISEGRLNEELLCLLNSFTLEELIALKLEAGAKVAKNKLYGMRIFNSLKNVVEDAVLVFALSACRSREEAACFLGLNKYRFDKLIKKYKTESYFHN